MEKDGHNDHQALFVMGASFKETDLDLKNTEVQQCLLEQTLRLKAGGCPDAPPLQAGVLSLFATAVSQDGRPHTLLHIKSASCWKAHHFTGGAWGGDESHDTDKQALKPAFLPPTRRLSIHLPKGPNTHTQLPDEGPSHLENFLVSLIWETMLYDEILGTVGENLVLFSLAHGMKFLDCMLH